MAYFIGVNFLCSAFICIRNSKKRMKFIMAYGSFLLSIIGLGLIIISRFILALLL
jgi:hypothetical protein